ncbi:hypothetical protein LB505_010576 [Fusarium chuoi]|nr:hypothetical protein LB505_010576 [Fusarium chuoi]
MNAIFNFLSSPLKQPAERPPPSSMPLTASSRPSLSPREQRLAKRAADRFSEPAGRSPRSRLSNVSLASTDDNTAEISVVSRRRETITMAPPLSVKKRISTSTRSSPIHKPKSNGSRVASSPALRSSPRRRESAELGESSPALITASPAFPKRVSRVATSSPAVRSSPRARQSAGGPPDFASSPAPISKRGINGVSRSSEAAESPRRSSRASRATEAQTNGTQKTPVEQPEEAHFGEEEEEAQAEDDKRYEFVRITDHRWADGEDEIELLMQWKDGETSWIAEELLHTDNRQALFAYWRSQPNGRPKNPNDDDEIYHVFAIRKHRVRNGIPQVFVEWLGYDASENTWEDQDYIEGVAPKLVDAYFDQVKGKGKGKGKIQAKAKSQAKINTKSKAKPKAQAKTSTRGVTRSSARVSKR